MMKAKNGKDFDQSYDQAQLKGHRDAVALFEAYAKGGDNAELNGRAGQTPPHLEEHGELQKGPVANYLLPLHRYLIEVGSISVISDQMRTVRNAPRTSCRRRIRQVDASHAPGGEQRPPLGSVWRGLFSSSSLAARPWWLRASSCAVIFDFDFGQSCNLEHGEFVVTGPDIRGASSLEPGRGRACASAPDEPLPSPTVRPR